MKILVTGSEGFIGKHLCNYLTDKGHQVVPVDKKNGIDLSNKDTVLALPDVDIVFHAAAFNGTKHFYQTPYSVIRDNILPTQFLLDRYAGKCDNFIFTGTCESYAGAIDTFDYTVPTNEEVPLVVSDIYNPRWSYGGSKITGELMCVGANVELNQGYTIIRYHNIYGPGQVDHFIPEFANRTETGNTELYGHNNTRSFMYITDAIEITEKLLYTPLNQAINVGSEDEVSIEQVAQMILDYKNISTDLILRSAPHGSVTRRCPDITLLKSLFNFTPKVNLHDGLRMTLDSL